MVVLTQGEIPCYGISPDQVVSALKSYLSQHPLFQLADLSISSFCLDPHLISLVYSAITKGKLTRETLGLPSKSLSEVNPTLHDFRLSVHQVLAY